MNAPPESDADRTTWIALLSLAVEAVGSKAALADLLRVERSTAGRWLDGTRGLAWPSLRAALRRSATRHPEAIPAMVAGLADLLLDARGRWLPEGSIEVGDYRDESGDVMVALGALTAAVRRGAGAAELAPLRAALLQEAEEAGKAAAMGAK
jgi:hypothetical protein